MKKKYVQNCSSIEVFILYTIDQNVFEPNLKVCLYLIKSVFILNRSSIYSSYKRCLYLISVYI